MGDGKKLKGILDNKNTNVRQIAKATGINYTTLYSTLPDGLNGAFDGNRLKTSLKNSLYPLMYLFGKNRL